MSARTRATRSCAHAASAISKVRESKGNLYERGEQRQGAGAAGGRRGRGAGFAGSGERLALAAAGGGDHRGGPGREDLDGASLCAVRTGARAARARHHSDLQHRSGLQFPLGCLGLAALAVRAARARRERGPHCVDASAARRGPRPARLRAGAHRRRGARQHDRPPDARPGGRLHSCALAAGVLPGVQPGRFGHHRGRGGAADRCLARDSGGQAGRA